MSLGFRKLKLVKIISLIIFVGCAHPSKENNSQYYEAAFDDHNRAPASIASALTDNNGTPNKLDPLYMKSQADYYFTLGEAQSLDGQHQKAIESFKMVQVYDQNSAKVPLRLSAEYVKVGSMTQAFEQAELAVQRDPSFDDARLMLGGLYSAVKDYDKAIKEYNQVLTHNPKNTEAPLYIGAIYAEQKEYEKSIKYFQSLAKNEDYSSPHLAYYYTARVRFEQEGAKYQRASEEAYKKALELKPDHVESIIGLGQLYTKLGQNKKAIELYATFQKERGPNSRVAEILVPIYLEEEKYDLAYEQLEVLDSSSEDSLNIKMRMALILIEQKKYDHAIKKLNQILTQVPDSDKIQFYLAAVYEEVGKSSEAIKHFKLIPNESEFFGEATVHAAYLLKQQDKTDSAIDLVRSALEQRKDVPQFYAVYASLLEEKKEFKTALEFLNQAVEKFPEHVQLRFYLGTVQDKLGNKDQVVTNMKKVIEMDPNHVQGLNYLAYTYSEMNVSLDEAETLVQRAMKLEPKDAYVLDTYGWILYKQGKKSKSIQYLESALQIQPNESVIAEHLGDVYLNSDMVDRAKQMYEKAIQYESDETKSLQLRQKITSLKNQKFIRDSRMPASAGAGK